MVYDFLGPEKYNFLVNKLLVNKLSELSIPATDNFPKFYTMAPACMNNLRKSAMCSISNGDVIYQWLLNDILPHWKIKSFVRLNSFIMPNGQDGETSKESCSLRQETLM